MVDAGLTNFVLKIPLIFWSPYTEKCSIDEATLNPTSTCPKPGYNNEILGQILDSLKVSYEIIPLTNETDWGHLDENGVWQGHLGEVIRGVYDMAASMYIVTTPRLASFDFSYPIAFVKPVLFFRKGRRIVDESSLVKVFNWKLWTTYLCTGVLLSLVSGFSIMLLSMKPTTWTFNELMGQMWLTFSFFTDQCHFDITDYRIKRSFTVHFFLLLLGILSLMFIGTYQGSLLSALIGERSLEKVTGADDLVAKVTAGQKILISPKGMGFTDFIQFSSLPIYRRLKTAFVEHPIVFKDGNEFDIAKEAVSDPKLVSVFATQLHGIQNTQKICGSDYSVIWDVPAQFSGFVFRKHDEKTKQLQHKINTELADHKFIQHIFEKYKTANPEEVEKCNGTKEIVSVDLRSLTPLFWLVFMSGMAGLLILVLEILSNKLNQKSLSKYGTQ